MNTHKNVLSEKDISALYIKETVNGKQRFTSMAAYCKCCGAISIYPEWKQKNEARFKIVKQRRTPNFL